jgi:hypothetical protein
MKPPTVRQQRAIDERFAVSTWLQKSRRARWWNATGILVGGTVPVGVASYLLVLAGAPAAPIIICFAVAWLAGVIMIAGFAIAPRRWIAFSTRLNTGKGEDHRQWMG